MKHMQPDIVELLVLRATEGLNRAQADDLQGLLAAHGLRDSSDFDLAAAAAANAFGLEGARRPAEVPGTLKARLLEDAGRFFGKADHNVVELRPSSQRTRSWNWGWATAAALALVLIGTNVARFGAATDYASEREQLLASGEGTIVVPWAAPEDPEFAEVTGDVVWNDEKQEGYLLLSGMPANDPTRAQYQLWLVDPERDSNPVDGGVFDVAAGKSVVIVPIDAKLRVSKPAVFAITLEKPGGVVVSEGPLLVVASTG